MEQRTGEILTNDEIQARIDAATTEEKEAIKKAFESLTPAEYDKYSKLPESERPAGKAFDKYLSKKERYWEPRTQRQAFYAGFYAAKALFQPGELHGEEKSGLEAKMEALQAKAEALAKTESDGLEKSEGT